MFQAANHKGRPHGLSLKNIPQKPTVSNSVGMSLWIVLKGFSLRVAVVRCFGNSILPASSTEIYFILKLCARKIIKNIADRYLGYRIECFAC